MNTDSNSFLNWSRVAVGFSTALFTLTASLFVYENAKTLREQRLTNQRYNDRMVLYDYSLSCLKSKPSIGCPCPPPPSRSTSNSVSPPPTTSDKSTTEN